MTEKLEVLYNVWMNGTSPLSLSATLQVRGFKKLVEKNPKSFPSDDAERVTSLLFLRSQK